MLELRSDGLASTIFSTRKLWRDKDVAAGFNQVHTVADIKNPSVPWNLYGFQLRNTIVAQSHASLAHEDMILAWLPARFFL